MSHLIDLDSLPRHITHKGCQQSENEETGRYVHCSYACFIRASPRYKCTIARVGCVQSHKFDRYNFFELLYCQLNGELAIFLPLAFIIIVLIFRFISATVDQYIAVGITYIAQKLKMSEQMAGVTLIAFANGAGDVMTAYVASSSRGGISYNIGSLYGAHFFLSSFVIALTILLNKDEKPIKVNARIVYRDIGFYIFAILITLFFAWQTKVYWQSAALFLSLYFIMVIVVYIQDRSDSSEHIDRDKALKDEVMSKISGMPRYQQALSKRNYINKLFNDNLSSSHVKRKILKLTELHPKRKGAQDINKSDYGIQLEHKKSWRHDQSAHLGGDLRQDDHHIDNFFDDQSEISQIKIKESLDYGGKKIFQHSESLSKEQSSFGIEEEEETPWEEKTSLEKVSYLLDLPFDFVRKITMPPCEEEKFNKVLCTLWPFPGIVFILYVLNVATILKFQIAGLIFASILSYIFFSSQKGLKDNEVPTYFFWICLSGTIMGLMWTYVLSDMLIDMLNLFAVIFKLDNTYMGITILGIGNSLPDALTTIALAKKGFAQMGLTGCYAGQLFGLLVGFGLAQLKQTLSNGEPQDFALFKNPQYYTLDIIVIFCQLTNLLVTAISAIKNQMHFTRPLAYFGLSIYIMFFAVATGIQISYIVDQKY